MRPLGGSSARRAGGRVTPGRPLRSALSLGVVMSSILMAAALPVLGQPVPAEATTWIDAPLDGAILPLGTYSVVTHSADQGGVAEVVFEVGGLEAAKQAVAGAPRLRTSRFTWTPPGPGTFLLAVRARSADGGWGAPGTVTVVVSSGRATAPASSGPAPTVFPTLSLAPVEPAGPTALAAPTATAGPGGSPTPGATATATATAAPTPTPTPTRPPPPTPGPTPTPTPTAAPTACLPPAPTLTLPASGSTITGSSNPPAFEWMYDAPPTCAPTTFQLRISINRDLSSPLYDVSVSAAGGPIWTWTPPSPLPFDPSCTAYYWAVTARGSNGAAGGTSAIWTFTACR